MTLFYRQELKEFLAADENIGVRLIQLGSQKQPNQLPGGGVDQRGTTVAEFKGLLALRHVEQNRLPHVCWRITQTTMSAILDGGLKRVPECPARERLSNTLQCLSCRHVFQCQGDCP